MGQRANPLSGRSKYRVSRRQRRFSQARWRVVGYREMDFDGGRLRYLQQWERIEIGLHDTTIFDGDLLMHAEALEMSGACRRPD